MFRSERQEHILRELSTEGRVTVIDLARRFDVSEDCIRKDLKQLDALGKCRRVYGGAVTTEALSKRNVHSRIDTNRDEKRAIAQKAFSLLRNDMTVFLDISTTNIYLADLVGSASLRLIVVSNMMDVLKGVAANPRVEASCPGGKVNLELNGFVGAQTLSVLQRMRFDLSFVGTLSIDAASDSVSTFDMDDGLVKQAVIGASDRTYLVSDSHKFDSRGNFAYARLTDFTGLITDDRRPSDCERVRAMGLEVL